MGAWQGATVPWQDAEDTASQIVVAMGDYCAGRIDPIILYVEDNGRQVSHCLIFVTGVTDMEREKN